MGSFPALAPLFMTTPAAIASSEVWRPHVTVACVVADGDRYLMVEEEVKGRLVYNQPAGHLEENETLFAAALRETLEETAWTVELQYLIGVQQWRSTEHSHVVIRFSFAARAISRDEQRALDPDINRALWMSRADIVAAGDRVRSPLVLPTIDAWLAGQRLPLGVLDCMPTGRPK